VVAGIVIGLYIRSSWHTPAGSGIDAEIQGGAALGLSSASEPRTDPAPVRAEAATASSATTTPPANERQTVRIEIHPVGRSWLTATVDGRRVVYRMMQSGEREVIELSDEVVLRVGAPAAFAFSIDGTPGRALERVSEPVTIRLTRQNYGEFLQP
jgi:RodZ C-terminal domain